MWTSRWQDRTLQEGAPFTFISKTTAYGNCVLPVLSGYLLDRNAELCLLYQTYPLLIFHYKISVVKFVEEA